MTLVTGNKLQITIGRFTILGKTAVVFFLFIRIEEIVNYICLYQIDHWSSVNLSYIQISKPKMPGCLVH